MECTLVLTADQTIKASARNNRKVISRSRPARLAILSARTHEVKPTKIKPGITRKANPRLPVLKHKTALVIVFVDSAIKMGTAASVEVIFSGAGKNRKPHRQRQWER